MNKDEIVTLIYTNIRDNEFPKVCPNCGKHYETFTQFVQETEHVGEPVSYDAQFDEWHPEHPLGTVATHTCDSCGSAIAVSSEPMPREHLWEIMEWAHKITVETGVSVSEILQSIRIEVDKRALEEK